MVVDADHYLHITDQFANGGHRRNCLRTVYLHTVLKSASLIRSLLMCLCLLSSAQAVLAESYLLDLVGRNSTIGEIRHVVARREDTLVEMARRYDLGYDEIVKANPKLNRWVPGENSTVTIPSQFILPDTDHDGIVINLAELRLYYFVPKTADRLQRVYTFPVSIGRMDWKTPLGKTKIASKVRNPAWIPPPSIKAEHAADGDPLPNIIPGGIPENPLGLFALRLGIPGYLIHGTDARKELGIGMRVTHGCVRMYPEDIEQLFNLVGPKTQVIFVDQPIKVGWNGPDLLVEIHTPLEEDAEDFEHYSHRVNIDEVIDLVDGQKLDSMPIDQKFLEEILRQGDGIPTVVARMSSAFPPAKRVN